MSLRRWMGWEPKRTTTVVERDDEGRPAKWVTTVEPEFDVNERDNWYAFAEYEDALCPQCGGLRSECSDATLIHHPRLHTCLRTASQIMHSRRWHKRYEDTEPDASGWVPTDGSFVWVAPEELGEDENGIDY